MKKFVLICLLAGYGQCFAQNIDLKDLQYNHKMRVNTY
jgi:hypothetical protein